MCGVSRRVISQLRAVPGYNCDLGLARPRTEDSVGVTCHASTDHQAVLDPGGIRSQHLHPTNLRCRSSQKLRPSGSALPEGLRQYEDFWLRLDLLIE